MRTSDAHLHDLSCGEPELYVACGTRPEDWDGLPRGPGSVRCYGVHPWHSYLWGDSAEEMLLSRLDSDPGAGVGEIGMDSSREVAGMAAAFESQLSIASERGTFATVHNVGCDASVADAVHRFSTHSHRIPCRWRTWPPEDATSHCRRGCCPAGRRG